MVDQVNIFYTVLILLSLGLLIGFLPMGDKKKEKEEKKGE